MSCEYHCFRYVILFFSKIIFLIPNLNRLFTSIASSLFDYITFRGRGVSALINWKKILKRISLSSHPLHPWLRLCLINFCCASILGEFCGKTVYDPGTHVCCCGKVYKKKLGYQCCEQNYYNPSEQICCQDGILAPLASHCPAWDIYKYFFIFKVTFDSVYVVYNKRIRLLIPILL